MEGTAAYTKKSASSIRRHHQHFCHCRPPFTMIFLLTFLSFPTILNAALPDATIELYASEADYENSSYSSFINRGGEESNNRAKHTLHAKIAAFGPTLHFGRPNPAINDSTKSTASILTRPPSDDEYLCNESTQDADYRINDRQKPLSGSIVLVPRGNCFFTSKVLAAQRLGADGVIIYNNLESHYDGDDIDDDNYDPNHDTNNILENIGWPEAKEDYECSNGQAWIPLDKLSFSSPPYNSTVNDVVLSGSIEEGNLCALDAFFDNDDERNKIFSQQCPSHRCFLTGRMSRIEEIENSGSSGSIGSGSVMQACCAWDIHFEMNTPARVKDFDYKIQIPSTFITMEQGALLLDLVEGSMSPSSSYPNGIVVIMYERYYNQANTSGFLLWILGTLTTWLGSWLSASDARKLKKEVEASVMEARTQHTTPSSSSLSPSPRDNRTPVREGDWSVSRNTASIYDTVPGGSFEMEEVQIHIESSITRAQNTAEQQEIRPNELYTASSSSSISVPPASTDDNQHVTVVTTENPSNSTPTPPIPQQQSSDVSISRPVETTETLDLQMIHVILFIIFASASLLILFFFKLYNVVRIFYTVAASGAVSQAIFLPLYGFIGDKFRWHALRSVMCKNFTRCGLNEICWLDVISFFSGYTLGTMWLWFGFYHHDAEKYIFYWITQNIMGISVCIVFLSVVRLNSLRLATALLIAAFIYDIFFVFITPHIFNDSIMMTVATGGGSSGDADFCEKYPHDKDCSGGNPLPMLLNLPRINDYRGGMSLLGLGDIVLPGLLLSFAARLDVCTQFVKFLKRNLRSRNPSSSFDEPSRSSIHDIFSGYFAWLTLAYSTGLLLAYIVVFLSRTGQPALLYLVPVCLGTMMILAWRRKKFAYIWENPRALKVMRHVMLVQAARPGSNVTWGELFPRNDGDTDSESDDSSVESTDEPSRHDDAGLPRIA